MYISSALHPIVVNGESEKTTFRRPLTEFNFTGSALSSSAVTTKTACPLASFLTQPCGLMTCKVQSFFAVGVCASPGDQVQYHLLHGRGLCGCAVGFG